MQIRTDLAVEAHALWQSSAKEQTELAGVRAFFDTRDGFAIHTVEIFDEAGSQALGKPVGRYVTVELDGLLRREERAFERACTQVSEILRDMLQLQGQARVLVAALGNRAITPDAIGPVTHDHVLVTRHLKSELPSFFDAFRSVSALCSGVLGTTGVESGALVSAMCQLVEPDAVIAVDALASREPGRLCRTIQIADSGIIPGSGVGNAREALTQEILGVPVIALGVPTVVDASTLALDLAQQAGVTLDPAAFDDTGKMIVTPRDIDKSVADMGKLLGYSINLAVHEGLTVGDLDMYLS